MSIQRDRLRRSRPALAVAAVAVATTAVVAVTSLASSGATASGQPAARSHSRHAAATPSTAPSATLAPSPHALPADSGTGRRAVFDQAEQRVWIVAEDGRVRRTYLVSGSTTDNLRPGTYHVYSRARWAVGIDETGVMQWYVRFAHGTEQGAPIGFHSIPTHFGRPLQKVSQLGTPQSDGCVRQRTKDAIAMWHFARLGTKVVVVAS